jgi:hypothetical protein
MVEITQQAEEIAAKHGVHEYESGNTAESVLSAIQEALDIAPCKKCGNNSKDWPKWEGWQEKLLPVLNRFAEKSGEALYYGEVWNAIRKYVIHPLLNSDKGVQESDTTDDDSTTQS